MGKRVLFIVMVVVGLLLIVNNHLHYTPGDYLFQWMGVPPWTKGHNNGVHLPVVIGLFLLLIGGIGIIRVYRHKYPKIRSRLIISCIVFIILFPMATEQFMFLVHRNTTGVGSVDIHVKESECQIRTEDDYVKAYCSIPVFNYGDEVQLTLRPVYDPDLIEFEETTLSVEPHSRFTLGLEFRGSTQQDGNNIFGSFRGEGIEIKIRGEKKVFY